MQQNASEVYDWVVDDVIGAVQGVFQQEGIDSSVLQELRDSWSRKLREKDSGSTLEPPPQSTEDVVETDQQQEQGLKSASSPHLPMTQITSTGFSPPYPPISQTHYRGNNQDYISQFYQYQATGGSPALTRHHHHQHRGERGSYGSRGGGGGGFVAQPGGYPTTWIQGTNAVGISPVGQPPMLSNYSSFPHQSIARGTTNRRSINGMYSSLPSMNERPISTHPIPSNAPLLQPRSTPVHHFILPNSKPQFYVQPSHPVPQVQQLLKSCTPVVKVPRSLAKRKEAVDGGQLSSAAVKTARRAPEAAQSIPQRDGSDNGVVETSLISAPVEKEESEDDVSLSDVDEDDEPTDCVNCLYGQYDKVSRIKNRWRCVLKHGIFSVNGQDYLFKQANGEFTF